MRRGRPPRDLTGQRFHRLVALHPVEKREFRNVAWLFRCDCGKEKVLSGSRVTRGQFKSCGCGFRGRRKYPTEAETFLSLSYSTYQEGAKKRGYAFNLSFKKFKALCSAPCHYCGGMESRSRKGYTASAVGVDRKDSRHGYSAENCVPCCRTCNRAKRSLPYGEFKAWARRLAQHALKNSRSISP